MMSDALLELSNVGRVYGQGENLVHALTEINLTVRSGEFIAIMGQSGSGKSTLMNLLGCLDRPSSGVYQIRGVDVGSMRAEELAGLRRETFGFVFQRYHLMANLSAVDNVAIPAVYAGMPREPRRKRASELLSRLGMSDRLQHRPGQLSGGQQQRVSIARALMNGGQIILADEPTGALDSASGREVMQVLHELHAEGHTIILITHDASVASHAQRIVELADGRIVNAGSPDPARSVDTPTAPIRARSGGAAVFSESLLMALRSLLSNRMRTALTVLGIVIGVASVVAMLAIGEGAKRQVIERIEAMGTDLLSVKRGVAGVRGSGSGIGTLTPEDLGPINALAGVAIAVPETDRPVLVRQSNRDLLLPAVGTAELFPQVRNWPVKRGIFFSAEDVRRHAQVIVLGASAATQLYDPDVDPLGRFVMINNAPFQVIGVMTPKGVSRGGTDLDYQAWIPYTTAATRVFGQRHFRDITVKVKDGALLDPVERSIRTLLIDRHRKEDFHIRNMSDLIDTANQTQNTFTYLLASIAIISLLVGGIGVMNIMLVSVTERTREIGIRMAVGARSKDVLAQFLAEAMAVCLWGGLVGIALGVLGAWIAGRFTGWMTVFAVTPMLLAFGSALLTGLVFGFLPARKAARLDPVEALVRE